MKNITHKLFLSLTVLFLALAACQDGNDFGEGYTLTPNTPHIEVTPTSHEFAFDGETKTVTLKTNVSWKVSAQPDWVSTITPNEGTGSSTDISVSITASKNTTTGEREGNVVFTTTDGSNHTATVACTQKNDTIYVTPKELPEFLADGESKTVYVTASSTWTMSAPKYEGSATGWLTLTPQAENFDKATNTPVKIEAGKNTSTESRTAKITFSCGKATPFILTVTQQGVGKHTSASPTKFDDINTPDQATRTITVTSNENWTATISSDATSWGWSIKQSTGTVTVTVAKNPTDKPREGTVTITGNDSKDETLVKITQPGIILTVDKTELPFQDAGGSQDLTVTCNTNDWTATSSDESVCTVKKKDNNKTLTVTCLKNTTTDERKATVTVKAGEVTKEVNVTQEPNKPTPYTKVTSPADHKISFDLAADTKYIEVESNEEWDVSEENTSWLDSVTKEKKDNGGRVKVTSKANNTETAHTATITIKGKTSGNETPVTVTQEGIKLSVNPTSKTFGKDADSGTFTITCNTTWTATSSDDSWCTVNNKDDATLTVSVKENTATTERKATVTVQAGDVKRTIAITQTGADSYIYIDGEKSLTVGKDGGEQTIKVSTNDGPFKVTGNPDWCEVKDVKAGSFVIAVKENGTLSKRSATLTVTSKSGKTDTAEVTQEANGIEREDYGDGEKKI